ncbi:hypothetical protein [Saccharopolyspora taberi]|uniref:Uncharacterized protein n=1 Tax=Saccharopolyspora taberi TaxID=60895 RepID=A0ABN3VCN6_9PSEU
MDPETPEADAVEQAREAEEPLDENDQLPTDLPAEANPADLAEQHRTVPEDEAYEHD